MIRTIRSPVSVPVLHHSSPAAAVSPPAFLKPATAAATMSSPSQGSTVPLSSLLGTLGPVRSDLRLQLSDGESDCEIDADDEADALDNLLAPMSDDDFGPPVASDSPFGPFSPPCDPPSTPFGLSTPCPYSLAVACNAAPGTASTARTVASPASAASARTVASTISTSTVSSTASSATTPAASVADALLPSPHALSSPTGFKVPPAAIKSRKGLFPTTPAPKFLRTRSEGNVLARKRNNAMAFAPSPVANHGSDMVIAPGMSRAFSDTSAPTLDLMTPSRSHVNDWAGSSCDEQTPSAPRPIKRSRTSAPRSPMAELAPHHQVHHEHSSNLRALSLESAALNPLSASTPSSSATTARMVLRPSPKPAGPHLLPSKPGKSDSIRRITPETLVDVLERRVAGVTDYKVIDCRFPFEYEGGHIQTAINVNRFEVLDAMFTKSPTPMHSTVLIFHCEFSSHRAPAMAMHLRAQDRILNVARYPDVYYPEIYVLEGGYKAFYLAQAARCVPQAYIPMDATEYVDQCRREMAERKRSLERSKSSAESFGRPVLTRTRSCLATIPASPESPTVRGFARALEDAEPIMLFSSPLVKSDATDPLAAQA
ncbi:cell division cycle- protein [Allomyces javanicus]|nr:cell division cycle- protein [Allomyces javanicus]